MPKQLYMVFDVEAVGLHGEGFAVGWVVIDAEGQTYAAAEFGCDPAQARGGDRDREWVAAHVRTVTNYATPAEVRAAFWAAWRHYRKEGATLVTDVAWPVEARFLAACIDDDAQRATDAPYPLIDLPAILLSAGFRPLEEFERRPRELPRHSPLADARYTARILSETLLSLRRQASLAKGLTVTAAPVDADASPAEVALP